MFEMDNLEESKKVIRRMGSRSKSDIVKEKIKKGIVEHNSFLEPITSEMCRTSKSIPRKGYTSVSRIAKG